MHVLILKQIIIEVIKIQDWLTMVVYTYYLNIDLKGFSVQFRQSSALKAFLIIWFAKLSGVKIWKSCGWIDTFVETGCMWNAECCFFIVTRISTTAPYMSFVKWGCFTLSFAARLEGFSTHTARWRWGFRWRWGPFSPTWNINNKL